MAATLSLEVAPPGGYLLPLGYSREPPKSSRWGTAGNLAGGPLNPGLRERTWVLARDVAAGRCKGLRVSQSPLRRSHAQRPHPAPGMPVGSHLQSPPCSSSCRAAVAACHP